MWLNIFYTLWLILLVVAGISIWLVEPHAQQAKSDRQIARELAAYARSLARTCFGSRNGLAGLLFALLPAGAYGLGLALQSTLAVELGLDDFQIGWLNLWSKIGRAHV